MKRRHAAALVVLAACSSPAPAHLSRGPRTSTTAVDGGEAATREGAGAAVESPPASTTTSPPSTVAETGPTPSGPGPAASSALPPAPKPTAPEPASAESSPSTGPAPGASVALATWYGSESGSTTANGDHFDPEGVTFAHLSMQFGTRVRFCGPLGCVVATCTDRGPAAYTGKQFDLSRGAFRAIAPLSAGVVSVTWAVVG